MRLTVVGCAGSAPAAFEACSSYLVTEGDTHLLLDLGTGSAGPLQRYAAPDEIDHIVISHAHADHYGDLQALAYHRGRLRAAPANLIGPSDLPTAVRWLTSEPDVFTFTPAGPGEHAAGPMTLRLAPVRHGDTETWAVRVDDALCYTADTEACPALDELAAGCRIILAEACHLHGQGNGPHLSGREAGELAARSGARLLVVTHLRAWTDVDAILAEAAEHAGCPVVRAVPGLEVRP